MEDRSRKGLRENTASLVDIVIGATDVEGIQGAKWRSNVISQRFLVTLSE
jgi:hypothetical protein